MRTTDTILLVAVRSVHRSNASLFASGSWLPVFHVDLLRESKRPASQVHRTDYFTMHGKSFPLSALRRSQWPRHGGPAEWVAAYSVARRRRVVDCYVPAAIHRPI